MQKSVSFAGYNWNIRAAWEPKQNPGPNYFSDYIVNVNNNGHLVMNITKWEGRWYCC
jgi:hypothetical protein